MPYIGRYFDGRERPIWVRQNGQVPGTWTSGHVGGQVVIWAYFDPCLEEGVIGKILKFADDTKLFTKTKEIGDEQKLQDDIDKLVRWSENGRCYSILGNVNVYTQGLETLA